MTNSDEKIHNVDMYVCSEEPQTWVRFLDLENSENVKKCRCVIWIPQRVWRFHSCGKKMPWSSKIIS